MDHADVLRLRAFIEACRWNEAQDIANSLPEEAVRACIGSASQDATKIVTALCALAPAGNLFRTQAASALPGLVRTVVKTAEAKRATAARKKARKDLSVFAKLLHDWGEEFAEESPMCRVIGHLRAEYACVEKEMDSIKERAARDRARQAVIEPPDVSTLSREADDEIRFIKSILGDMKSVFSMLGPEGMQDLAKGKADGIGETLRELWVRLASAEGRADVLLMQACQRSQLESLIVGEAYSLPRNQESRRIVASLRTTLEGIASERAFCRAMKMRVPRHRGISNQGSASQEHEEDSALAESSDDDGANCEWEAPVVVNDSGDDSDSHCDGSGTGVSRITITGNLLSLPPPVVVRRAPSVKRAGPAKNDGRGRERLKSRLGKKRKRKPLSP